MWRCIHSVISYVLPTKGTDAASPPVSSQLFFHIICITFYSLNKTASGLQPSTRRNNIKPTVFYSIMFSPQWCAFLSLTLAPLATAQYFETPPGGFRPFGTGYNNGAYPQDFRIFGSELEAVHDSQKPSTGLAVDSDHKLYLTYPRNAGPTPNNVVICTSFNDEAPWPNATIQNCTTGQDPRTCFINVQNIVRDDRKRLWVVDSGIPANASSISDAIYGGAKLMSFNETTAEHLETYVIPENLLSDRMNMNDMRVNTTLGGREGYAFVTDASTNSSLLAVDLEDGSAIRRLFNTTVVRADEKYVGTYDGELIYTWNGTKKSHLTTAADGIALGMYALWNSIRLFAHRSQLPATSTGVSWLLVASTTPRRPLL